MECQSFKHELSTATNAPSSLRFVYAANGGASSSYTDLAPQSILNFKEIKEFDRYIKVPVHTERYLGFHLNTGTSAEGKWIPELKIYDWEVYYDEKLLNGLEAPETVQINRAQTTRIPIAAINADGMKMTDLSEYTWKGEALIGCDNISIDAETGELVVAPDAAIGRYSVTLTNKENPELFFTKTIDISIPQEEMPDYFHSISGNRQIVIPKQGKATANYSVLDKDGQGTNYGSLLTWKLEKSYPGVTLNGTTITVLPEAPVGTVTLLAQVGDYKVSLNISLVTVSASVNSLIAEIEGDKFVVSPYYGEKEFSTAQYHAKAYDLTEISEGVKWSVKGAPAGVTIDENTGVLSVPPNMNDTKVKIIADKDGMSAEKLVTIVSRYDGAPNLLRLPGVSISQYANKDQPACY